MSGHTSFSGLSATNCGTGKVLVVEIMSKFCFICHVSPASQEKFEGTSNGLEFAFQVNIFNYYFHTRDIWYTKCADMGTTKDTKG
jgi:hypothetical protein